MLIGDLLKNSAKKFPEKIAVVLGQKELSFKELNEKSNKVANALLDVNLPKATNLAILSANHFDYPAIYFGAAKSGYVLAHLSTRFTNDELVNVINKTDIGLIFVHGDVIDNLLKIKNRIPGLSRIIVFGHNKPFEGNFSSLQDFINPGSKSEPNVSISPSDAFAITYTGGTTGFPKGVVVNHASRIIGSVRAEREFNMSPHDVNCCSTPLFHIAGLFVWFQTSIKMGCTCVMLPAWDPEKFIDLVEKNHVTGAFLVPTQINSIINHPKFSENRLRNWRYCSHGGAPTSKAQLERMHEKLPRVIWEEQYGQSEAGNLTIRPSKYSLKKAGSVGKPFSDLDLAIFGNDNEKLPIGRSGEVVTKGVQTMMYYYGDPDQTKDVFTSEGWLKTGDIGYFDEDGFLYLVDRSKDMIISGGENIFPTEIENLLYKHPNVSECAVFGIPDDYWGESPKAYVVLKEGGSITESELIDFCRSNIARYKTPKAIKFVYELPKTAVGKIQKNILRDPYWIGRERDI
ncbi:MAG: class I adenylate-forming enzyme family protein [Pseudomonadota bacterium]|nr:class I adenylate-forming enzyme family protein [Pseudomonadota bacterium]